MVSEERKARAELIKKNLDEAYKKFMSADEETKREFFGSLFLSKSIVDGQISYIKSQEKPIKTPEEKDEFTNMVHHQLMGYCFAMVDLGFATMDEEPANK